MSDTTRSIKIVIDSIDAIQSAEKIRANIAKIEIELKNLAAAGKLNTSEYAKTKKSLDDHTASLAKHDQRVKETERILKNLSGATYKELIVVRKQLQAELHRETRGTEKYNAILQQYRKVAKEAILATKEMNSQLGCQPKIWNIASGAIAAFVGNIASGIFQRGMSFLIGTFREAYNKIKEFEQANANLASVMGTTRDKIALLTEEAKRLGAATEYTASEVSALQMELAKLGFIQREITNMTEHILRFATAAGANLPEAAKLAGASLRAFGLDTTETERVVSTLAVATSKCALDFNFLDSAMSSIAPVAKTFGFTIEETTTLLGTLANSGFDASMAATSTRNILLNLADANGKLAKTLGQPIKSLDDLIPALIKLRDKGIDLAKTLELTDKRSVAAFNTFLDGAESMKKLKDSITDVADELKKMQEERMNTLEGSIKNLESAWEGLMLSFSKSTGPIKSVVDGLTSIISTLNAAFMIADNLNPNSPNFMKNLSMFDNHLKKLREKYDKLFEDNSKLAEAERYDVEVLYKIQAKKHKDAIEDAEKDLNGFLEKYKEKLEKFKDKEGKIIWKFVDRVNPGLLKEFQALTLIVNKRKEEANILEEIKQKYQNEEITPIKPDIKTGDKEGTVKSFLDLQLKNLENFYKEKKLLIDLNKNQEWNSESKHQQLLLEAEQEYLTKQIELLTKFHTSYKKLDAETNAKLLDAKLKLNENRKKLEENTIKEIEITRDKQLKHEQDLYNMQKTVFEKQFAEGKITQEQYETLILGLDASSSQSRKLIWEQYQTDILALEINTGALKEKAVEDANKSLLEAELKAAQARRKLLDTIASSEHDLKKIAGISTPKTDFEFQLKSLQAMYDARVEMARKAGATEEELEKIKTAFVLSENKLRLDAEEKTFQLKKQIGIANWQEEYEIEKRKITEARELNYIDAEEEQEALKNLRIGYLEKWFDYYKNLMSGAVNALQEAEISNMEAKYDAEIAAAQGNADEIERLEREKAQKKLDIEKKYADVQFAIKASEIIASTAVAIMQGFAQLGPIAGAIAAVLMGITGAAQLVAANAERQKVKSRTLDGGGSSSSSPKTGEIRVRQQEQGKYDVIGKDDNKTYTGVPYIGEAETGFVSSPVLVGEKGKELVISDIDFKRLEKHINYPVVISAINDARNNMVPQRAFGKYDIPGKSYKNGSNSPNLVSSSGIDSNGNIAGRMLAILQRLEKGDIVVQTNYGVTEMEAEQKRKADAESKFTKKL